MPSKEGLECAPCSVLAIMTQLDTCLPDGGKCGPQSPSQEGTRHVQGQRLNDEQVMAFIPEEFPVLWGRNFPKK